MSIGYTMIVILISSQLHRFSMTQILALPNTVQFLNISSHLHNNYIKKLINTGYLMASWVFDPINMWTLYPTYSVAQQFRMLRKNDQF